MNFKTFIIGLFVLILAPILVIGGFAAYTYLSNARSQSGLLHCRVEPPIVLTGDATTYTMSFLGEQARPEKQPPPPVEMIFVIDISSSMCHSLPDMIQAARTVVHELVENTDGHIRLAMTWFREFSRLGISWTTDPNVLYAGLNKLVCDGTTDGRTTFPPINQLLTQAQPNAIKVIVFYTDGAIFPGDSVDEIGPAAKALRDQNIQIFAISPPQDDASAMVLVTGHINRVLRPSNLPDLVKKFRFIADSVIGLYGDRAQLTHRLDGRNFSVPVEDSQWRKDNTGNLQREVGYLAFKSIDYQHTLIPQTTGLWRIGLSPPEMTFFTPHNQLETMSCEREPLLLVLSPWLLFLAFLPALLWLLAYLMQRRPAKVVPAYIPPPIRSVAPPSPLPSPSALMLERQTVMPTLFIGLGGTGRQALHAIQEQLRAAHLGAENQPYRFLFLDLDASLQEKPSFLKKLDVFELRKTVAPTEIRQATPYLPSANQVLPSHLTWFNARDYLDATREELELSRGTKGQRVLARLALFQWLDKGKILSVLTEECQALLDFASVDSHRQIILLADRTGGVGSGWLVDIARLLRRIALQKQQTGAAFVPEIIGVLSSAPHHQQNRQQQQNRQALDKELETAQMAGAFPQRVTYKPNDELLDKTDNESPFNWLFSVSEPESTFAMTQSAALSAVLVERYPRWTLLSNKQNQGQCLSVQAKGIHVMPDLDYQLVKREILLRLLGAEVLLDLELDAASQKLVVKSVSDSQAVKLLIQWNASEPKGTPWQLLLNAVVVLEGNTQFLAVMAEKGYPDLVWFQQAFVASVTRQLRGMRSDGSWVRPFLPGQAVVALRLFAKRLAQRLKPQAPPGALAEIVTQMIDLAESSATQLEQWLTDFVPLCEAVGKEQSQFAQQRDTIKNREGQVFIDGSVDKQRVVQWAKTALQQWVGSKDITATLCERLFFTARLDKNDVVIALAVYVEERQEFLLAQVATAAKCLENYADTAAQQVPTLKVAGALAHIEAQPLQQLARNLVDTQQVAEQVVMVMPTVTNDSKQMSKVLEHFRKAVVEPAGHAPANYCYGDDHSAIRRLELRTEVLPELEGALPFVQAAEQAAELARQRAMTQFEMELPIFPPALRIALSQPDAFRSFSSAYKAGHIVKPEDDTGRDERGIAQWIFGEQKMCLTFGGANTLADAAANYVYLIKNPPVTFTERETPGDFSKLAMWQAIGGPPENEEVFVLIAIMVEHNDKIG